MLIPVFAVATAIIAAVADSSSGADLVLCGLAAAPLLVWAYVGGVPLLALSLAVIVPAVVAQRSGQLEPLLFEVSLLAFVIGRSASWPTESVALGLLALLAPVVATADPGSVRDLDGDLDPRHRLPVGLRPRGRTPGRARRPAPGHPARARAAGPAGRAAPDRPRRPRLRGPRARRRDAPGHQCPPRAAPRPRRRGGGAAFGRGGGPAEHARAAPDRRAPAQRRRGRRGATGSIGERDPGARGGCSGRRSRGRAAVRWRSFGDRRGRRGGALPDRSGGARERGAACAARADRSRARRRRRSRTA